LSTIYCVLQYLQLFFQFKKPVIELASLIKRLRPTVPIIVGGPLVFLSKALYDVQHNLPFDELKEKFFFIENDANIDYYIVERRGEKSFLSLLNSIYNKMKINDLPNLAIPKGEKILFTKAKAEKINIKDEIINSDLIPFPANRQNKTDTKRDRAVLKYLVSATHTKENRETKSVNCFRFHLIYFITKPNSGSAVAGRGNWI